MIKLHLTCKCVVRFHIINLKFTSGKYFRSKNDTKRGNPLSIFSMEQFTFQSVDQGQYDFFKVFYERQCNKMFLQHKAEFFTVHLTWQ